MHIARRHTSIPIPKPLDLVIRQSKKQGRTFPFNTFMVMTQVPEQSLAMIPEVLSDRDIEGITSRMKGFMQQLRAITRRDACPAAAPFAIGNTLGGPIQNNRVWGGPS